MDNVKYTVKGNKLTIEIDLEYTAYETAKSQVVATTRGWKPLPERSNIAISLNCIRKPRGEWKQRGEVR